jgi:hypothetical protein
MGELRSIVFENRELRRIFGPKRAEVAGGWRRLHNEELHKLYTPPIIIFVTKSIMVMAEKYNKCIQNFRWET